jgi:hypothetical protein
LELPHLPSRQEGGGGACGGLHGDLQAAGGDSRLHRRAGEGARRCGHSARRVPARARSAST